MAHLFCSDLGAKEIQLSVFLCGVIAFTRVINQKLLQKDIPYPGKNNNGALLAYVATFFPSISVINILDSGKHPNPP